MIAIYRLAAPPGSDGECSDRPGQPKDLCDWRTSPHSPDGFLTVKCQNRWGQTLLFAKDRPLVARRYRVFDGETWGPATASLALAAAQARAVALGGRVALLWADDGGIGITVTWNTADGFSLAVDAPVAWAEHCRSLLNRHG